MRFSQVRPLASDKSKLNNAKPTVMISIGIQDKNAADDSHKECPTRKHNQNWNIQQPFYVEEPYWIDINPDYTNGDQYPERDDPYIMSRGKKFKIKSSDKPLEKPIEDYEEFLDYTSKSKRLSTKNRVHRSVETSAQEPQSVEVDERRNQEEETRRYNRLWDPDKVENPDEEPSATGERPGDENAEKKKKATITDPVRGILVHGFETHKSRNSAKESLYSRKFATRNRTIANDTLSASSLEEKRKMQHEEIPSYIESGDETVKIGKRSHSRGGHFAINTNKGRKRGLGNGILVRGHDKRGSPKISWISTDYKDNIDRKKTTTFEQTRLRDNYFDKIENFSTYGDLFIPSRGKKPLGESENLNKRATRPSRSSAERWEDSSSAQDYAQREEPESEEREAEDMSELETDKDDSRLTDARLATKPDSKSFFRMRNHNYREKRNAYEAQPELREEALLRSIEQGIAESAEAYLKPRDKHGNLLDLGDLSTDPFFIMRGKKASRELANSVTERRDDMDDVARAVHYSIEENLLKMLLTEKPKCNKQYCNVDTNLSLRGKPVLRNRRDPLDNLLSKYDPFVIIRGKRTQADNF